LGRHAYRFIDFLQASGQSWWQVLPLTPTGYGDSPYQSPSSLAGNPYLIDLERLIDKGLLLPDECEASDCGGNPDKIDYGLLYLNRLPLLRLAFERGKKKLSGKLSDKLSAFRRAHAHWLPDYALFMAAKERFGMVALDDWPDPDLRARVPSAVKAYEKELAEDIAFHEFIQYCFFTQWRALKYYANWRGIRLIGDMPIYVSSDSVERWTRPDLFLLDEDGAPSVVAGVPPDCFTETGQLWGNPLYDWEEHARTGYSWWLSRMAHMADCFDMVRIDHFLGFYRYWAVPVDAETAETGCYHPGPDMTFVDAVRNTFPDLPLIAEDLGNLDDDACAFFKKAGFPGMNVLIYAFDPNGDNPYLPHNAAPDRVLYTSTHDAPSFLEWLTCEASPEEQAFATDYLALRADEGLSWGAIRSAWASTAGIAMAPLQDVLGLGADARINIPATLGGNNWRWRVRTEAINDNVAERLRRLTWVFRRLGNG